VSLPTCTVTSDAVYLVTNKCYWLSLQENVFNLSPVDLQGREVGESISLVHNFQSDTIQLLRQLLAFVAHGSLRLFHL